MTDQSNGNGDVFVRVTNRDIWNKLLEIEETVKFVPEDRKRLRSLELKVYTLLAGLSTALVGFVIAMARGGG